MGTLTIIVIKQSNHLLSVLMQLHLENTQENLLPQPMVSTALLNVYRGKNTAD